ncbi:MAG: hypothetical protein K8L99_06105, partial [Anaerolineae bacterium]|nr:hypothetical protein [Anaerolineae bacterium]
MVAITPDLLQTKLAAPLARSDLIARPRLLKQFNDGLSLPLTLICAPAGFGKTTLLSEWLASESGRDKPLAWISLDEDDSDPGRFLTYLVYALANVGSVEGEELLSLLQSPQPPSPKAFLTTLISRLEMLPHHFVLALDDYHLITSQTLHDTLVFLLDHLPLQMHLVLVSREDPPLPLARLRARNQLAEIRADDLRFTMEEASYFLGQRLGFELSTIQVAELDTRTEGWIAGLQLAALAMKGHDDISKFISAFTGSHRFILDYLTEEVLSRQPEAIQKFLLQTSFLNRLCGPLCDVVTGRTDGQAMLELIERGNLFLIPLDDQRCWYRYHHLFSDMLRNRLWQVWTDSEIVELHRRVSHWFASENLIEEAIIHAVAARDYELAASIMEGPGSDYLMEGRAGVGLRWLQLLPQDVITRYPRLSLNLGWWSVRMGQFGIARKHLEDARSALQTADIPPEVTSELYSYADLIEARIMFHNGETEQTLMLAKRTLSLLSVESLHFRYIALSLIGSTHQ